MFRRTSEDLGLDQVLSTVAGYSLSEKGAFSVRNARPLSAEESYLIRQAQVRDTMKAVILSRDRDLSPSFFPYLTEPFEFMRKNPTGSLSPSWIYDMALFIESAGNLRRIFSCVSEDPATDDNDIRNTIGDINDSLLLFSQEVHRILESPGVVKDSYPTVRALIEKADKCRHDRTSAARQMMRSNSSFMQEDNAVLRDGRIVLPVKNELRGQLEGYVQGSSQTGSTVFMEPFRLVDLNNDVNLAIQEIELEKARLVRKLSDMARDIKDDLEALEGRVTKADFLYSFAVWAMNSNCCLVNLCHSEALNLIKARHPLLKDRCVPIDLYVPQEIKAVVLTGPNAGGKTVTMKTAGLFVLLNQICGYVPASDGTSLMLFDRVYTDIGDEQSIENHLSTFSGHMKSIGDILRRMTERSLVILDELGSGTDPQEGAALARSILEYCTQRSALTLTTSHHGVLKQYAYSSENVLNASMEFDEKTLEPTFKVISGLPGESHAIDAAKRMHLPKSVTATAQKYMGQEAVKISTIIRGLEQKQKEARDMENEIRGRLDEIKRTQKGLEIRERELLRLEKRLKEEELSDFDDFVKDSRKLLEGLVMELREGEITKEKTRKVREHILELERQKGILERDILEKEKTLEQADLQEMLESQENVELKEGMDVLCGQYKREGTVIRKAGEGRWVVAIGPMKFTFKETDLSVPKRTVSKPTYTFDKGSSSPRPKLDLDLRGYRLADALDAIDDQIEACCVHGITTFSVIHGYGDGILSTGIHRHLSMNANVQSYNFAHPDDGGQGKTYVILK